MSENSQMVPQHKPEFKTSLIKYQDNYMNMIEEQFLAHRIVIDEYQMTCARNALAVIDEMLRKNGIEFRDPNLDQSSLTTILQQVTSLRLNASAMPSEIYFQIRNQKKADGSWGKKLEMGIEGDGNDALLRNFGVNVEKVGSPWIVREGDHFEYPTFDGFDQTPPKWQPQGSGKVIRVVYPIRHYDGSTEFLIQERDDVAVNLRAHIRNNLMNETFGIAESRFKAKPDQLKKIDEKKQELLLPLKQMTLDQILNEPAYDEFISPAWKDNGDSMIIRKMRNNAVKKYPKDFGSHFTASQFASTDDSYNEMRDEVRSKPREVFDVVDVVEPIKQEPKHVEPVSQNSPTPLVDTEPEEEQLEGQISFDALPDEEAPY